MEQNEIRIVTVDRSNVAEEGFFCYKSKKKAEGYCQKRSWLEGRFAEGMRIKIVYEGKRSVGFVEYTPGEYAWRAVHAEGYLLIHCLWVVGKGKGKGYGSRLVEECLQDARATGRHGVAMVTSSSNWLAGEKVMLKNGFEPVDHAPPTFKLFARRFGDASLPSFPTDWDNRCAGYGEGLAVVYAPQCPYIADALRSLQEVADTRHLECQVVELTTAQQVQEQAPSPYGVYNIVYNGELLTYQPHVRGGLQQLLG